MKIEALFPIALGCTELDRELTKEELDFFKRTQESKDRVINEGNTYTADYHILDKKLPPGVLMDCDQVLDVLATHVDATPTMKEKSVLESYSTYNIVESEKERVIKTIKSREAIKQASKKAAQKPKTPAAQKPKTPSVQKPKTPAAQKPKTPPQKMSRKNSPTKVAKCDDKTTRRSSIKTKNTNKEEKFVNVK